LEGPFLRVGKDEESDAIKSRLRARYADSIRLREAGAKPQDFDLIGTEFHRWVRDNGDRLGLTQAKTPIPEKFAKFIDRDFDFYSRWCALDSGCERHAQRTLMTAKWAQTLS
jgi:hypothetical protein